MCLITNTAELVSFCQRLTGSEFVTVDTEFMRERTYWPKLCLVQVAGPEEAAAIDPLTRGMDLAPLFALLVAPETMKVFHAARQDLEIFYHLTDQLPAPVFDTQVAAMVCGFGDQVGYETLVARLTKAKLDKASRFTDWSLRPLSPRQVEYAMSDVTHLRQVYRKLKHKLETTGRGEWLAEEMAQLTDPWSYQVDPLQAFRRIKSRTAKGRFLAVLRELAAWREREAQERDVPRTWVLRDEALLEIAHHTPKTVEELARTRGLGRRFVESPTGQHVLAIVARGLAIPERDFPEAEVKRDSPRGVAPITDLLRVLLKMRCDEQDVAQRLVASSDDLEAIAVEGDKADVRALHGWRRQVFGEDALKVREGHLALAVRGRKLTLVEVCEAL